MSVVTHHESWLHQYEGKYTFCGELIWPPYIIWHERKTFFFCAECCVRLYHGLTADLIQMDAIVNLRRLYPQFTLQRCFIDKLNEDDRKEANRKFEKSSQPPKTNQRTRK
jgi:hypothetical protein